MKNVFIDSNIWLSLYHFTNDDIAQFNKLKNHIGKNINLILTQQVYDEVIRNRENKLFDAIKNLKIQPPSFPTFLKGYKTFHPLKEELDAIRKKFDDFVIKIKSDIDEAKLPADETFQMFFSNTELLLCDNYIQKAYDRYKTGNPPGKNNSYGDAINWECLLDTIPNNEDLYVISSDKDYCSPFSNIKMNYFLIKEWETKKNSKIYFYSNLRDFLSNHVKEIELKTENKKQDLINLLYNSSSFFMTHTIIELLSKYDSWTESQIEQLCSALENNCQISWIIEDSDILEFYLKIIANLNYNKLDNCSTKRAIDLIRKITNR